MVPSGDRVTKCVAIVGSALVPHWLIGGWATAAAAAAAVVVVVVVVVVAAAAVVLSFVVAFAAAVAAVGNWRQRSGYRLQLKR